MKVHHLKILPCYFNPVIEGRKPFEIRYDDRDYNVGDIVVLDEYDKDTKEYSGRFCLCQIKEIFDISFIARNYIAFTFNIIYVGVSDLFIDNQMVSNLIKDVILSGNV